MRHRSKPPEEGGRIHRTPMHEGPESSRRCLNILVADDRKNMLKVMQIALQDLGHRTIAAEDGLQALEAFIRCRERGVRIDLVITDLKMPNMDGIKLTRALKNIQPDLPIMIVTSTPIHLIRDDCIRAGAFRVMDKPFSNEEIESAIEAGQKQ